MIDSPAPAPAPRAWGYDAFIDELRPLIDEVKDFEPRDKTADSTAFKTWRYKLSSLCNKIDRTHLDSNCGVDHRQFRVMWATSSRTAQQDAFDRDMRETLVELEHIVRQYEKFGEPMMKNTAAARALKPVIAVADTSPVPVAPPSPEREWPKGEKASWKWIRDNIPMSVVYSLSAFVATVAVVSFGLGAWLKSEPPQTAAPAKVAKP